MEKELEGGVAFRKASLGERVKACTENARDQKKKCVAHVSFASLTAGMCSVRERERIKACTENA